MNWQIFKTNLRGIEPLMIVLMIATLTSAISYVFKEKDNRDGVKHAFLEISAATFTDPMKLL